MKFKLILLIVFLFLVNTCVVASEIPSNTYLTKPTGQYGVGFEDFHWINQSACPDLNYNGKNQNDFSATNKKHCHEITARIYYPSIEKNKKGSIYEPTKSLEQEILSKIPNVTKETIIQFNQIKSFSVKKAEIIKGKKFPVLLFSPGLGSFSQMYENIITELVSHGYIVIGVNTPFVSLAELPNGHIVQAVEIKSPISREKEHQFVAIPAQDLIYVFNKIHTLNNTNALFSAIDLNHIGLFGHSIGARATEDVVQTNPVLFQALATLDGDAQASQKKFSIPFMDMMSAKIMTHVKGESHAPFELANNSYLVVLSPNDHDSEYSYHLNFSDLSTLQYLPVYQEYKKYLKQHKKIEKKFDFKLMAQEPTAEEQNNFTIPTFVLFKKEGKWNVYIIEDKKIVAKIDIKKINHGLVAALANLPDKPVNKFSDSEIAPVKKLLLSLFSHFSNDFLGTGDGREITSSINTYLLQFFDTYLKNQKSTALEKCTPLTNNTLIICG